MDPLKLIWETPADKPEGWHRLVITEWNGRSYEILDIIESNDPDFLERKLIEKATPWRGRAERKAAA